MLAATHFALARALWAAPAGQGRDRPRARTLAEQAREAYGTLGEARKTEMAEVQGWLGRAPAAVANVFLSHDGADNDTPKE